MQLLIVIKPKDLWEFDCPRSDGGTRRALGNMTDRAEAPQSPGRGT